MFTASGYTVITATELRRFKASWPCHGIEPEIEAIALDIDARGDLVDIEYLMTEPAENETRDDWHMEYLAEEYTEAMGAAISAMADDVKEWQRSGRLPEWAR